ncbi:MAG: nucleoside-triphosphatase [Syntrophaceae bacterium]
MLILTGERGCGKTTFLQRLILEGDLAVQGFLSLKIVENGVPVGIRLLTLPWREEIFMGVATPDRTKPLSTGHYAFESEAFDRVDERFKSFDAGLPFVLDEFGRLEMKGLGHFNLFQKLVAAGLKLLVVVRRDLLDQFLERYAASSDTVVLDLESGDEGLERRVYDYLAPAEMTH